MKNMDRHLIIGLFLLLTAAGMEAQNIEVTVTGIRSEKGQIAIGVFLDNESFEEEKEYMGLKFPKTDLLNDTLTFSFSLAPGLYGLSILDEVWHAGHTQGRFRILQLLPHRSNQAEV